MQRLSRNLLITLAWFAAFASIAGIACSDDGGASGQAAPVAQPSDGTTPDDAAVSTSPGDAASDASDAFDAAPSTRALFIGNSFTSFNDLPAIYRSIAPGASRPVTDSVAYGGYTLAMHLGDAKGTGQNPRLETLLGLAWDQVLLQEQSQIPAFASAHPAREASMKSVVALSEKVAATGATSVLFMTWGYAKGDPGNASLFPDYPTMQSSLETGYREMALAIDAAGRPVKIAPAGLAFRAIYDREVALGHDPVGAGSLFMQLYGPDLIHPALPGSYITACVVAATLHDVDPTTLAADVAGIDAATKLVLQTAARDVVNAEKARPRP